MRQGSTSRRRRGAWRRLLSLSPALAAGPVLFCAAVTLLLPSPPAHAQGALRLLQRASTQPSAGHPTAATQPYTLIAGEPQRFDAFDGLFKLTLPAGWSLVRERNRGNRYSGEIAGGTAGLLWFMTSTTEPGVGPH